MQRHDLYFLVYPPLWVADTAAHRWQQMLIGCPLPFFSPAMEARRLHLTLQHLGQFHGSIPPSVLDAAIAAGSRLACEEPFGVCLQLLQSRGGSGAGSQGTVELTGLGAGVQRLRRFQRALGDAMRQTGFAETQIRSHFVPHMTLHYGVGGVQRRAVAPLAWTVGEFALVDSLYGLSKHDVLARWPLVARQQSFSDW
jgi:2'-5' RNA ligase